MNKLLRKNVQNIPTKKAQASQGPRLPVAEQNLYRQAHHTQQAPQGAGALSALMPRFSARFVKGEKGEVIISVSKKISKKAVVRNTIKRRVRAALRDLPANKKQGMMIIARPGSENIKGEELKRELKTLIGL